LVRSSKPTDKSTWPELNLWFAEKLEKMHAVLGPVVKNLNPAQFEQPDSDVEGLGGGPPVGNEPPA
jgi:hypothetical protein